ncbi:MAG: hypothetical protein LBB98_13090 [Treponema sp.]|jgi:hypothetical protein|nr:hypothetical protein [Treponema sp.]
MCPDRQILSVYHDREIPSPWKEKMELHLAGCPDCRAVLAKMEELSAAMREDPAYKAGFSSQEAGERVWNNALAGLSRPGQAPGPAIRRKMPRRIWNRSVTIPLPAVVAAAVFFVIAFTLVLVNRPSTSDKIPDMETAISAGMDLDTPGVVPVSNMNDVLRYLGQDNSGTDFMIIRLPETKHFMSAGEPAIIRAADYSRRTGNQ